MICLLLEITTDNEITTVEIMRYLQMVSNMHGGLTDS